MITSLDYYWILNNICADLMGMDVEEDKVNAIFDKYITQDALDALRDAPPLPPLSSTLINGQNNMK